MDAIVYLSRTVVAAFAAVALAGCEADGPENVPSPTPPVSRPSSPAPSPTDQAGQSTEDVVLVYSADGNVYGETIAGERVVFADRAEDEVWPSLSSDGSELLYQVSSGPPGEIVLVDLKTNTSSRIGAGQYPSFAAGGRAAWVINNATDRPRIIVGPLFSEPEARIVAISNWDGPILVHPPLALDRQGDYIYYTAGWEESTDLYQTNAGGDPDPFPLGQAVGLKPGFHLFGPYVRDRSSVDIFGACCMEGVEDPWESFDVGRVKFTEGGPVYDSVIPLNVERLGETFAGWYPQVISLGNLWREVDSGRWVETKDSTWIVANQIDAWLVSEGGRIQNIGELLIEKYDYRITHSGGIPGTFEGWSAAPAIHR